ncbi:MAG TPA: M23 family metallopeptidase [Polyangia bacterium]|jgi:murein DD-endopeptidase MepM/ murein hydrolase activator NlpD|nr:M23 family metallopeptidase [Polyangia bacterium]
MIDTSETIEGAAVCGLCNSSLLMRRYVQVEESSFYVLCSVECSGAVARAQRRARWAARRRATKRLTLGVIFAAAYLAPHQGPIKAPRASRATASQTRPSTPALQPGWFGPEWPPSDTAELAALGRDAWLHPLAGPVRRMPRRDSRVFGAVRPGDRAPECRNGHCGVDLGGEIWGEHVYAVHDGVVDWVKRGPNPDRGGQFVRIAHHNGTVFTLYFHLAAIAPRIERGAPVKGGEVIGLLGDTGVRESGPHLHFGITVKPGKDWPEKYMDPEPLIALWPLHIPLDGSEVGLVTTVARPGVPLGSALGIPGRKRKLARKERASEPAAAEDEGGQRPAKEKAAPTDDEPEADDGPSEPASED